MHIRRHVGRDIVGLYPRYKTSFGLIAIGQNPLTDGFEGSDYDRHLKDRKSPRNTSVSSDEAE